MGHLLISISVTLLVLLSSCASKKTHRDIATAGEPTEALKYFFDQGRCLDESQNDGLNRPRRFVSECSDLQKVRIVDFNPCWTAPTTGRTWSDSLQIMHASLWNQMCGTSPNDPTREREFRDMIDGTSNVLLIKQAQSLRGSDLRGADLSRSVFIESANLEGAIFDRLTILPSSWKRENLQKKGAIWSEQ